jgi:hypothetical protein
MKTKIIKFPDLFTNKQLLKRKLFKLKRKIPKNSNSIKEKKQKEEIKSKKKKQDSWNHQKKKKSINQNETRHLNSRMKLKSSIINMNFNSINRINKITSKSKAKPKKYRNLNIAEYLCENEKLKHQFISLKNNQFKNRNLFPSHKKQYDLNQLKKSVFENNNLHMDKSLHCLLNSNHSLSKKINKGSRKTKILNFFFKKQTQQNNIKIKSKFQKKYKKEKENLLVRARSSNSLYEEEFNIFGSNSPNQRKLSLFNKSVDMAKEINLSNAFQTAEKRLKALRNRQSNSSKKQSNLKNSNFKFRKSDNQDDTKVREEERLKKRFKRYLKQSKSNNSKYENLVISKIISRKNSKHKSQDWNFLRSSVNEINSGQRSISQNGVHLQNNQNSFFNRRQTKIEFNLTPKNLKEKKVQRPKKEEIDYDKFKLFNPKKKKKINFEKLNKYKISLIKSPRSKLFIDSNKENTFNKKVKKNGFTFVNYRSNSSDFSHRMNLPKNYGNSLNKRHLMINQNDYLDNWASIPRTIPLTVSVKSSTYDELQIIKHKNLVNLRKNYKNLFEQHLKQIKTNAASIFNKCTFKLKTPV